MQEENSTASALARHPRRGPSGARGALSAALSGSEPASPSGGPGRFRGVISIRGSTLAESIRAHLAPKVDVRDLAWLEQLETLSDPGRHPDEWQLATAYLGIVPLGLDPALPEDTAGMRSTGCRRSSPSTTGDRARRPRAPAREALVHQHRLRPGTRGSPSPSCATIYTPPSATPSTPPTCSACSSAAGCSSPPASGARRAARAAARRGVYRFGSRELEVTDPFAVLRPPRGSSSRLSRAMAPSA